MLDRSTIRSVGALLISGRSACVSATTAKKLVSKIPRRISGFTVAVVFNPPGAPISVSFQRDARVVDQDVELAVSTFKVPGNLLVLLVPCDVEPDGLDVLHAVGTKLVSGGAAAMARVTSSKLTGLFLAFTLGSR
jgi:hypothetical protein